MKYIILSILVYYIYKKYIALPPGSHHDKYTHLDDRRHASKSGEYVDYEEVEDKHTK